MFKKNVCLLTAYFNGPHQIIHTCKIKAENFYCYLVSTRFIFAKVSSHLSTSVAGITETIAQLASGWVTDRNLFHKYHYHKAYLILCGLVNLLSPLATSYILLMVYAVFFAIFCGGYMALLLPVLVRRSFCLRFYHNVFSDVLFYRFNSFVEFFLY